MRRFLAAFFLAKGLGNQAEPFQSLRFSRHLLLACLLFPITVSAVLAQSSPSWSGRWDTFWRDGAAVVELQQDGRSVTGTYEPGAGRIEGQIDGQVLRGRWFEDEVSGQLIFAISDDGQSFAGRFDTGEWWNGRRSGGAAERLIAGDASPRETLQSIVAAVNDFLIGGDVDALRFARTLLEFEGGEAPANTLRHRQALLWDIIDLSTFRVYDAPPRPEADTATFTIGLDGAEASYVLRFVRGSDAGWRLVVEDAQTLSAALRRYLNALGEPNVAAARAAMARSPRGVMQRFLFGIHDWDGSGRDAVLSTLDLSMLPDHLHNAEGSLLADYLKNVLDRAGFIFLQEIPNNPNRTTPYVHYSHPLGDIVIARMPAEDEDAPDRWAFDAGTLRNLPPLYAAMQNLPMAEGVPSSQPLTQFFSLRERIRDLSPSLLNRAVVIENWQWLAILVMLAAALVLVALLGLLAPKARVEPDDAKADAPVFQGKGLVHAVRLTLCSLGLVWGFGGIGLIETPLAPLHTLVSATAVIGCTWFAILATGMIGAIFQRRAASTVGYADEIVTAMAIGIIKLALLVAGLLLLAEIVNLPYEGILAGLGVGGLALAFAARETVSNILGGILLLTDRPFRRGDLIETHGQLATIETVGIRSTRLKRLDDTVMIIPNAQLSDQVIVNWGLRARRRIDLSIGLTYDTPRDLLDRFLADLRGLILRQPRVDGQDIYIGMKDFGASAIEIECRCFFRVSNYDEQVAARSALVGDIVELAKKLGVNFAFPTRTIHIVKEES
ncbi:mechanosensitive ion channel family protein [Jannaschia seohaensis]|uniref:Small-conductance mechanosensitive channel n=1 Tax=Jannaschia seohaensis TaxID=475081 RepID=A0A2Y9C8V2_9RHOB|nr:mechanosensitive ion channel family protein [Jannaschia seohaensis]PWJ13870.1 small-conductance mechanosensitive channel [Jannaschia seohaensis]SSA50383.1 Small-conductance mechanosensitive channel [Jannaschia seohaensis]